MNCGRCSEPPKPIECHESVTWPCYMTFGRNAATCECMWCVHSAGFSRMAQSMQYPWIIFHCFRHSHSEACDAVPWVWTPCIAPWSFYCRSFYKCVFPVNWHFQIRIFVYPTNGNEIWPHILLSFEAGLICVALLQTSAISRSQFFSSFVSQIGTSMLYAYVRAYCTVQSTKWERNGLCIAECCLLRISASGYNQIQKFEAVFGNRPWKNVHQPTKPVDTRRLMKSITGIYYRERA